MKFSLNSLTKRQIDDALCITDLFSNVSEIFNLVVADLNGPHATVINHVSERIYFILSGEAIVRVDEASYDVQANDLIYIRKGQRHSINGAARYLVLTAPPFDPKNETIVANE